MIEIDYQRKIVKRLQEEGAYARKWSTQHTVGVPDLIIATSNFTFFDEIKLETDWYKNTVRTIGFTEKQKLEAEKINAAGGVAIGTVVLVNKVEGKATKRVTLHPVQMPHPRTELQIKLSELQKCGYDLNARKALLGPAPFPETLTLFLEGYVNEFNTRPN